jgi:hypothetical protein
MKIVRGGFVAAHALLVVACSGATTSVIEQPGDGGGSATDSGTQGGSDASSGGGGDGPVVANDASESGMLHDDAGHEAGGTCVPSPPDGGACNSLAAPAPSISIQCNPSAQVPAPTGGTIVDGVYVMTSSTYYAGGGACQSPEVDGVTWLVCGTSWQIAQAVTQGGLPAQILVANATVIPTGSNLDITLTCGAPSNTFTFGYDATPTTLRLHTGGTAATGRIDTFTRQ